MLPESIRERGFEKEWVFSASRSSGPGGQHVNKVSTRVELRFQVRDSALLDDEEKDMVLNALGNHVNRDGFLILVSQAERSQSGNRKRVSERFYTLMQKALTPRAPRKPTKPTTASREKRITDKKKQAEKKAFRRDRQDETE